MPSLKRERSSPEVALKSIPEFLPAGASEDSQTTRSTACGDGRIVIPAEQQALRTGETAGTPVFETTAPLGDHGALVMDSVEIMDYPTNRAHSLSSTAIRVEETDADATSALPARSERRSLRLFSLYVSKDVEDLAHVAAARLFRLEERLRDPDGCGKTSESNLKTLHTRYSHELGRLVSLHLYLGKRERTQKPASPIWPDLVDIVAREPFGVAAPAWMSIEDMAGLTLEKQIEMGRAFQVETEQGAKTGSEWITNQIRSVRKSPAHLQVIGVADGMQKSKLIHDLEAMAARWKTPSLYKSWEKETLEEINRRESAQRAEHSTAPNRACNNVPEVSDSNLEKSPVVTPRPRAYETDAAQSTSTFSTQINAVGSPYYVISGPGKRMRISRPSPSPPGVADKDVPFRGVAAMESGHDEEVPGTVEQGPVADTETSYTDTHPPRADNDADTQRLFPATAPSAVKPRLPFFLTGVPGDAMRLSSVNRVPLGTARFERAALRSLAGVASSNDNVAPQSVTNQASTLPISFPSALPAADTTNLAIDPQPSSDREDAESSAVADRSTEQIREFSDFDLEALKEDICASAETEVDDDEIGEEGYAAIMQLRAQVMAGEHPSIKLPQSVIDLLIELETKRRATLDG